jgi:SNF family Na+-dependent transporter
MPCTALLCFLKCFLILPCAGAVIGVGNVWRFPYLDYTHGGGTFLISYIVCLFVIGIPLVQAELALGVHSCCNQRPKVACIWHSDATGSDEPQATLSAVHCL